MVFPDNFKEYPEKSMICQHPHGILSVGTGNNTCSCRKFENANVNFLFFIIITNFIKVKTCFSPILLKLPFVNEVMSSHGCISASAESMKNEMK